MLNKKVREQEAKLDEAGDLQRFLRDLDHFQVNKLANIFEITIHSLGLALSHPKTGGVRRRAPIIGRS